MIFVYAAVISALIGAILGQLIKNRPGAGALLALALGPIGWLAVFAIEDGMRQCPDCRGRVANDATTCRFCRVALKPLPPRPEISTLPKALRALGLIGLVGTVIALAVNANSDLPTDDGMMFIGLAGGIPSFILLGIGIIMSHREYNNPKPVVKLAREPVPTQEIYNDPIPQTFQPKKANSPNRDLAPPPIRKATDTIKIRCKCGSNLNAKKSLSGRTLKCPKCKQPITVP